MPVILAAFFSAFNVFVKSLDFLDNNILVFLIKSVQVAFLCTEDDFTELLRKFVEIYTIVLIIKLFLVVSDVRDISLLLIIVLIKKKVYPANFIYQSPIVAVPLPTMNACWLCLALNSSVSLIYNLWNVVRSQKI